MTQKKIFHTLALIMLAAAITVSPLHATTECQKKADPENMKGKGCMMGGTGCMMLAQIPDLTEEQKVKIEKLRQEHQQAMTGLMDEMEKQATAMKALMKDPIDVSKVEAKIDEIAKMKADMQKKCLAHRLAVRALLTDEQKTKFGEMRPCMMGGMGCMMGGKMHAKCGMKHDMKMKHAECPAKTEEKK